MNDLVNNMNEMGNTPIVSRTLFANDAETPLGQVRTAAYIKHSAGVPMRRMRVLGRFAVVLLLEGSGIYCDTQGVRRTVATGDAILLFPELAHSYGPRAGEVWSELYVIFDGPVFDALRTAGLLSSSRPIVELGDANLWRARIESAVATASSSSLSAKISQLVRFLGILTEVALLHPVDEVGTRTEGWQSEARRRLSMELERPVSLHDIANSVGMSYETFRKRFEEHLGTSPARYRMERRIEAAVSLLTFSDMTLRHIAETLGFSDEFHLSNRFKQRIGVSPAVYRKDKRAVQCDAPAEGIFERR
jgi:AraC-like DNA-binding protein